MSAPAVHLPRNVCPGFGTTTDRSTQDPVSVVTPERVSATERDTCSLTLACISAHVATRPRGPHRPRHGKLPTAAPAPAHTRPAAAVETVGGAQPLGPRLGATALRSLRSLRLLSMTPAELPETPRPTQPRRATPVRAREAHPRARSGLSRGRREGGESLHDRPKHGERRGVAEAEARGGQGLGVVRHAVASMLLGNQGELLVHLRAQVEELLRRVALNLRKSRLQTVEAFLQGAVRTYLTLRDHVDVGVNRGTHTGWLGLPLRKRQPIPHCARHAADSVQGANRARENWLARILPPPTLVQNDPRPDESGDLKGAADEREPLCVRHAASLAAEPVASPPREFDANPARARSLANLGGPAPVEPARINHVRLVRVTESAPRPDDPSRPSQRVLAPLSVAVLTCYALAPTYRQTHNRLTRERGPASARPCHWCGRRAAEWACLCDHAAVVTGTNASGKPVTFDPDPAGYVPACRPCHRAHDAARAAARRSPLAITPRPARSTPARVSPEPAPERESLFAADPTDPTRWEMP